ncbi:MAG: acyltransferase [Bacteroidales bacterium]|nr:acyltransferase [Bacteroidales bacterium]
MENKSASGAPRLNYLDNLKVLLTVLVIFHHAGQAYGTGGGWAYQPSNSAEFMPWIWHFFSTNASFFMGLYFLISGYFVPRSYDRNGARVFIRKKLLRLGIPLLVMGGIMSAATGKYEIGHMWFVESLLLFCLVYALIRRIFPPISGCRVQRLPLWGLLAFALVMGVGSYFIRQVSPQDHWIWPFGIIPLPLEPAHYLQYVMMFAAGVLAGRCGWIEKMGRGAGAASLALGVLFAVGNYLRGDGPWSAFVWRWFGIYESLMCVFISFGLLWLFRECGNWSGRFWKWCAAQSYGAYVFHMILMLAFQHAVDGVWMGAFGKFFFIGAVVTVLSFVFTWLVRLIPGVKKVL